MNKSTINIKLNINVIITIQRKVNKNNTIRWQGSVWRVIKDDYKENVYHLAEHIAVGR